MPLVRRAAMPERVCCNPWCVWWRVWRQLRGMPMPMRVALLLLHAHAYGHGNSGKHAHSNSPRRAAASACRGVRPGMAPSATMPLCLLDCARGMARLCEPTWCGGGGVVVVTRSSTVHSERVGSSLASILQLNACACGVVLGRSRLLLLCPSVMLYSLTKSLLWCAT